MRDTPWPVRDIQVTQNSHQSVIEHTIKSGKVYIPAG